MKAKYPYPHKHIPIKGGHITVDENCSQQTIEALKKVVEALRNLSPEELSKIVIQSNQSIPKP